MKEHLLFSACGFDKGHSGISEYMLETAKQALLKYHVTVVISKEDSVYWDIDHTHQQLFILPRLCNKPLWNVCWHMIFFPLWIVYRNIFTKSHFKYLFLPAINRRLCLYYPILTIGTLHDLPNFIFKKNMMCLEPYM